MSDTCERARVTHHKEGKQTRRGPTALHPNTIWLVEKQKNKNKSTFPREYIEERLLLGKDTTHVLCLTNTLFSLHLC